MENFLPFTEDVMVVLVHKCAQQTHLLALHLETLETLPSSGKSELVTDWSNLIITVLQVVYPLH